MERYNTDCLIIGGGVSGLAIGRNLSKHFDNIFIVERNYSLGQETSSRNSEVILLGNEMVKAAKLIKDDLPDAKFLMPLSSKQHRELLEGDGDEKLIEFSYGNSQEVLPYLIMQIQKTLKPVQEMVFWK